MIGPCLAGVILVFLVATAAPAAAAPDLTHEVAKKHYELGEKLYQTSSYAEALVEFDKAYKLQPYPALLFNIARCHEVLADLKQAARYYRLFLKKKPASPRRSLVEARLKTLDRRIAAQASAAQASAAQVSAAQAQPKQPEQAKQPPQPPPRTPPPPAQEGSGWKRTSGWVALGVGGAALVTGVVFGALASGKASDFSDGAEQGRPFQELDELDRSGKRFEIVQVVGLIVGGVVAAAGGGLLLWDMLGGGERRAAVITPTLADGSVGLAGSVRF